MSPGGRPRQRRKKPSRLGAAIAHARGERSQREIALKAGVSVSYLSALEAGEKTSPGLPVLRRIAKALEVPVGALVGSGGLRTLKLEQAKIRRVRDRLARQQTHILRVIGDRSSAAAAIRRMFGSAIAAFDELLETPGREALPTRQR